MRVTLFLIIVSEYSPQAVAQVQKLKAFSDQDTDVALIRATDLKYVAENWEKHSNLKEAKFDPEIFNITGELTKQLLIDRMSWILKS